MQSPINTRDLRLQATDPRLLLVGSNYISLSTTSSQFKYGSDNVAQPAQSVVKASLIGALSGQTVTFSYTGLSPTPTASANTVTILPDSITGDFATITATLAFLGVTYTSSVSVSKVYNQLASRIQRPIDLITSANDGTGYTLPSANNYLELYNGSVKITSGVTYGPATTTKNGLTVAINTSTGQITVTQASANAWTTDSENFTLTVVKDTISYNSIYTITKAKAGSNGSTGVNARVVNLTTTQQAFVYDGNGANPTGTAIVTATAQNTSGTVYYEFLKNNVSQTNTTTNTYSYSPQSTYSLMPDIIEVRIRETTNSSTVLASDVLSLYGIKPGIPGVSAISGFLTNEAAVVAADNNGTVSSFAGIGGTFKVYDGITDKTSTANYSVVTAATVGVSITIDTAGVYTITAMSADTDTGYATLRAVYGGVTIDKVYSIAKSKTGTGISGASTYRIYIAAASSSATVTPPGTTQNGTTPNGWSTTPVALTGTQAQFQSDGKTPAGDTTTTWSTPYLSYFKVDTLEAITANTGNLTVSGTFKAGNADLSGTSMTNGTAGGILYNTGNFAFGNSTTNITYNGNVLTLNGNIVARGNIADSAINNDKIENNSITGDKIVAASITADKITGGTITSTDSNFAINIGNTTSISESGLVVSGLVSTGVSITRNISNFSTISANNLTQGYWYQIVTLGTTNWQTVAGITGAYVGASIKATGNTDNGTGTVKRILGSAISIRDLSTWTGSSAYIINEYPTFKIQTEYSSSVNIECLAGYNSFSNVNAVKIRGGSLYTLYLSSINGGIAQQGVLLVDNPGNNCTAAKFYGGTSSLSTITVENRNGISSPAIDATGIIRTTGNVIAYYSDDRLKTKLGLISNALEKLNTLSGFYYEPNETAQSLGYEKRREVGVSAQDVQKILPEIIHNAPVDEKYLTVDYERLIPLIIEAIKELDRRTK